MDAKNKPRPQPAERSHADRAASRLTRALAGGDPAGAAAALVALGRTLEGTCHDATASGRDDTARENLDPARGLRPSRNPAFAAHGAALPRRRGRWLWSSAVVGIAIAGAVAWWLAAHGPRHHDLAASPPTKAATESASASRGALPANEAARVQAAEADILESQVMTFAARMREPVEHASLIPPAAPVVAEKPAAPQTPVGTDFPAVGSLITQWRNEQAQLMTAERKLAAGRTAEARQLIEAVQTQIVLRPVTPDDPRPAPGNNATAVQLGRTLQLMDAGEEELALRTLHHAIEDFGAGFPAAGAGAGAG
ncbi:MAG: hypothetical protein ACREFJ_06170 [Acetobacteraceae bacterium]